MVLQLLLSTAGALRPAMHWWVSTQRRSCASDGSSSCRVGNLQETPSARFCSSPPFPFPKPMLFNVGKRMLPALATCGLPAKEPKKHTYIWPRERAPGPTSGSSVERHWAKAKTKCSFKPCWAHKTLSHVITTRRGQFRVLSSAMVNPLPTVHF